MSTQKKALLVTTVSGFIPQFEMNNVKLLQDMGYEIHYAANYNTPSYGNDNHRLDGTGIIRHQIDFVRSPFRASNFTVYRQLCSLMRQEHFDVVHCHTPMGGVMARLAAHATHTAPVIYTAHGFHFFRGASAVNWLCYYPMERFLSRYTNQQICINQEDYERAKKTFHAEHVDYIPGAGIDLNRIPVLTEEQTAHKRQELGFLPQETILLSSGELIKRKNHKTIIRAIAKLKQAQADCSDNPFSIRYVICGHGTLNDELHELVQRLDIADCVTFLGYRKDILEIYQAADLFLFPSYQEGLPMALLEAMASGLPVICSDIRGSRDLMETPLSESDGLRYCKGGIMVTRADDADAYCRAIRRILSDSEAMQKMGDENRKRSQHFSSTKVTAVMKTIYEKLLT